MAQIIPSGPVVDLDVNIPGASRDELIALVSQPVFRPAPPPDALLPRFAMRAPLVKRHLAVRPIAVIEGEIRRAVTPAMRWEDV